MQKKNTRGFTLLELLIALAILAIIAAILIPNFFATTDRARLRSDIQSARVIQNAIELYRAERGEMPEGTNMSTILETLSGAGFLNVSHYDIQTEGAVWDTDPDIGVIVDISGSHDNIQSVYASLPAAEQLFVRAR